MKSALFMDRAAKFDVLSMKRGSFMDERGFWTGLSMKRGIFVDEKGFRQRVNFSGSDLTKEIILILWKMGNSGC